MMIRCCAKRRIGGTWNAICTLPSGHFGWHEDHVIHMTWRRWHVPRRVTP